MSTRPREASRLDDHLIVHHYIRLFGRRPSSADLGRYRQSHGPEPAVTAPPGRAPIGVRLRLARLMSRV